ANAEEYWQVPELEETVLEHESEGEDNVYEAAYEGVTFQDSADDDQEGAVIDDEPPRQPFDLESEGESLGKRLRFLSTRARLWQIAARRASVGAETSDAWLTTARANEGKLLTFLQALRAYPIPEPSGSQESLMEYDRRRVLKEQLLHAAIGTCLD